MTDHASPSFWQRPSTRPGWWAVGLANTFVLMFIINSAVFMRLPEQVPWRQTLLPIYGIAMLLCGLAAGILGLIVVIRSHERSWLVWLTIVMVGGFTLLFVLGEFLVSH